ncbi:uncharacterized protein LOC6609576 [Drosophila sechellia]|uniref:GM19992 n=1 Tax=Drosophila sechellia TaxID=7238 RepID=B4HMK0_DROSE|nr:uncharacterized protein LOC6609576 [Drosophila sechellia]EDW48268.1 GM19992 [Drosophila sechellia]
MGDEESPAGPGAPGEAVDDSADTTTDGADTTTAGARMMMSHPWLAAAAVAMYATKVMWIKFREIGLAKQEKRFKNQLAKQSKPLQTIDEDGSESDAESDAETDAEDDDDGDVGPQVEDAVEGPEFERNRVDICQRQIEVSTDC